MADGSFDLISLIIGSATTLGGTLLAHHLQNNQKKKEETEQAITEIRLIQSEIAKLWEIYKSEMEVGFNELEHGEAIFETMPIGKNIFVFFDSAPGGLTKMSSAATEAIIHWYARAKGLVEQTNLNNEQIKAARAFAQRETTRDELQDQKNVYVERIFNASAAYDLYLKDYGSMNGMGLAAIDLKALYVELETRTAEVNRLIQNEIEILSEQEPGVIQRFWKKIKLLLANKR